MVQIDDPANLDIVVDYLSMDAVKIRAVQSVNIDNRGGDEPLDGWVRVIEPFGFLKVSAPGTRKSHVLQGSNCGVRSP